MGKKRKSAVTPPLKRGRVVKNTGNSYIVELSDGCRVNCRVKGNFRIKGIRTTNPVAVGDFVDISLSDADSSFIVGVEPRSNYIIRRASNLSKESHILASNINLALLVATLREPATPTTFIDRFLATAEAYSVPAALVLNKEDIWDDDDREIADALKVLYEQIGYQVLFVSAKTAAGTDALKEMCAGKITLFAGNSGVGKSSLINALVPEAALRTGEISELHHTGTHTTTFSEMIPLPGGGALIDVPGVKGFGTIDFETANVSHYFPEIFKFGAGCKYGDCKHINEPGCAVLKAIDDCYIAQSRYTSYLSILEDTLGEEGDDKYRKPF